jgi:5-methylcytosine-specific restriction endonuclease McrA
MPYEKGQAKPEKLLCVDSLRHTEYYGLQDVFDELYAKSKNGEEFSDLMPLILSRENILLAYRNIKTNTGSKTAGTDKLTIGDIGRLTAEQVVDKVRFIVTGSPHGYCPKTVRHKEIPKPYDHTNEGREGLHDNLRINVSLMRQLIRQTLYGKSSEYADNRISLFSAQWGKCAITGKEFQVTADVHCHHKIPREHGGSDKYENLALVLEPIHKLIHANQAETIEKYLKVLSLNKGQVEKLNKFREQAKLPKIT